MPGAPGAQTSCLQRVRSTLTFFALRAHCRQDGCAPSTCLEITVYFDPSLLNSLRITSNSATEISIGSNGISLCADASARVPCGLRSRASVRCGWNGRTSLGKLFLAHSSSRRSYSSLSLLDGSLTPIHKTRGGPSSGKTPVLSTTRLNDESPSTARPAANDRFSTRG